MQWNEQQIDGILSRFDQSRQPGATVGIAFNGEVLYRKGFGLANMDLPVTLSPTTKMRIGSTSKHFVALAYMLFVEKGEASLDDALSRYLPEFQSTGHVTISQLMGHVSGMRCSLDLLTHLNGIRMTATTVEQSALLARQTSLNFAPGERWSYSNGGYVLLTRVVEKLAGESLEAVLRKQVFEPAGMFDTLLRRTDMGFVSNSACPHFINVQGEFVHSPFMGEIAGEGGIVSTTDDMLRWMAHMDQPVVGSEQTWAELRRSLNLSNGSATGYGLGLMSGTYRGSRILHHPGGVFGAAAQMLKVVDHGLDIIVMVNRADADPIGLTEQIVDACLPDLPIAAADVPQLPKVGTYHSRGSGAVIRLLERDGKQFIALKGLDLPAKTDLDGTLRTPIGFMNLAIRFPSDNAVPDVIEFSDYGVTDRLARVEAADVTDDGLQGRFESDEAQAEGMIVRTENDDIHLHFQSEAGAFDYVLTPLGPLLWLATSMDRGLPFIGGTLEMDVDGCGFRFSTGRTTRLAFRRSSATGHTCA